MKCLRCGYCCVQYSVVIWDDEVNDGVSFKDSGVICKHLGIVTMNGKLSTFCKIHWDPRFEDCPCDRYGQIENSPDDLCRMGAYIRAGKNPGFNPVAIMKGDGARARE